MSIYPDLVKTGSAGGDIRADMTLVGPSPVTIQLTADYTTIVPAGQPTRPGLTGAAHSRLDYPRTIVSGTVLTLLAAEAAALITAGKAVAWPIPTPPPTPGPGDFDVVVTGDEDTGVSGNWQLLGFGASRFIVVGNGPGASDLTEVDSTDLATWDLSALGIGHALGGNIAYASTLGRFCLSAQGAAGVGLFPWTSSDGQTWTKRVWGFVGGHFPLVGAKPTGFLAVQVNATAYATSPDGIVWTARSTYVPGTAWTSAPYWDGTHWVVGVSDVDGNPILAYSTDGINFTETAVLSDLTDVPYFVAFDGTHYVAGTANDDVGVTATALTGPWTPVSFNLNGSAADGGIAYGGGYFMVVSSGSVAAYSADGSTWTQLALPSNGNSVAFGLSKFVTIGSNPNNLMVSTVS